MSRVIEVKISPTGDVTIQTKGYLGTQCQEASKYLEHALGITLSDSKTAELYETAAMTQFAEQR